MTLVRSLLLTAALLTALPVQATDTERTQRLISTDAGATELLLALGLGAQLVAVDVTSRLPAGQPALPNVGYHRTLSAEGLLSLQPDMVIGNEYMGPAPVLHALAAADIAVLRLPSAHDADGLRQNIRTLAARLGKPAVGTPLLATLDRHLEALASRPLAGLRCAFLLSVDSGRLRLAGQHTAGDALIRLLTGNNVADYPNYRDVSAESLLGLQADVILVAGSDPATAVDALLNSAPVLRSTPAGRHGRIVAVDAEALVSGLSLQAVTEAMRLSRQLTAGRL